MTPTSAPRFRFPAKRRLKLTAEFERVRREGKTVRGSLLLLGALRVEEEKRFRVGFVTSRRVGKAVVRNRPRRSPRELVRKRQHHLRAGYWFVLIARPAAANASSDTLEKEWARLATRAGILAT